MKKTCMLIYRVVLVLGCAYGIYCNLYYGGRFNPGTLAYYTIQSNILCLALFVYLVAAQLASRRRAHESRVLASRALASVKCACTMCILVTGLVYHILLGPEFAHSLPSGKLFAAGNFLAHTFTPAAVLLDYFLFDAKGRTRFTDPFLWAVIPYAYLLFVFVYRALGGRFSQPGNVPYFFLDTARFGVGGVILWLLGITVAILALWTLFVLLDRALGRRAAKKRGDSL